MPPNTAEAEAYKRPSQRIAMFDWLRVESNFKLITGSADEGSGRKLKKTDAYKVLLIYVCLNIEHHENGQSHTNTRKIKSWNEEMIYTYYFLNHC